MVLRPRQHSIGYIGDTFTGRKTQSTVSKSKEKSYKGNQKKEKTQNTHIQLYIQNSRQKRYTYKTQQVP